jgi:hypothetical protein
MTEGGKKRESTRDVNEGNRFRLTEYENKAYCESLYQGKVVCSQWLVAPEGLTSPGSNATPQPLNARPQNVDPRQRRVEEERH